MAEQDLWQAAWDGDLEAFKKVLSDHPRVNVNWTDKTFGSSVLNTACMEDNLEMVEILLRRPEVDVNAMDTSGFAPVWLALYKDGDVIWKTFAAHPRLDINSCDANGRTTLWWICYSGHLLALTRLLNSGLPVDVECRGEWNGALLTPLEIAHNQGHTAIIPLLEAFSRIKLAAQGDLLRGSGSAEDSPMKANLSPEDNASTEVNQPHPSQFLRASPQPSDGAGIQKEGSDCPVCLSPFQAIWAANPCGHAVCGSCYASMKLKPCCICRGTIVSFLHVFA